MGSIKEDVIKKMGMLGVSPDGIFREIMRARHMDYVLFSEQKNSDGLTQEDLYRAAVDMTTQSIGPVPGNEGTYAMIYTVAMSVDPMIFSSVNELPSPVLSGILRHAIGEAGKGKTVLFAGADAYLRMMTDIFVALRSQRVAVAVGDASWQEPLQLIYNRGRIMQESDILDDTERYDYIFYAAGRDAGHVWETLRTHLRDGGRMEALLPDAWLSSDETAAGEARAEAKCLGVSSLYHVVDGETESELVSFGKAEPAGTIAIGEAGEAAGEFRSWHKLSMSREAFAEADSWDYDLYAYNGNQAIQTMLSAGLLDPDFSAGSVYKEIKAMKGTLGTYPVIEADAITKAGIRLDLVQENVASDVKRVAAGDVVLCDKEGRIRTAVVPSSLDGAAAGKGLFVFRPIDRYSGEYLKAYFDGPIGQLFFSTMRGGSDYHLAGSRILRMPIPAASEPVVRKITGDVRIASEALLEAEEEWRKAKLDAINLMMKRE